MENFPQAGNNVEVEDKGVTKMATPGGFQSVTLINESGLYCSMIGSKRTD